MFPAQSVYLNVMSVMLFLKVVHVFEATRKRYMGLVNAGQNALTANLVWENGGGIPYTGNCDCL